MCGGHEFFGQRRIDSRQRDVQRRRQRVAAVVLVQIDIHLYRDVYIFKLYVFGYGGRRRNGPQAERVVPFLIIFLFTIVALFNATDLIASAHTPEALLIELVNGAFFFFIHCC